MSSFFGGPPGAVMIKLIVISFVVGVLLSFLGVSPYDIVNGITRLVERIYNLGFGAFEWIIRYFLLGAVIVVPIWLIVRLWKTLVAPRSEAPGTTPARRDDA